MVAQLFAESIAVDASILVAGAVVFAGIGIGLFGWTLVTVVRLTQLVGVLEEQVRQLANDIDNLLGPDNHRRR